MNCNNIGESLTFHLVSSSQFPHKNNLSLIKILNQNRAQHWNVLHEMSCLGIRIKLGPQFYCGFRNLFAIHCFRSWEAEDSLYLLSHSHPCDQGFPEKESIAPSETPLNKGKKKEDPHNHGSQGFSKKYSWLYNDRRCYIFQK